jgi:hypothetical protein
MIDCPLATTKINHQLAYMILSKFKTIIGKKHSPKALSLKMIKGKGTYRPRQRGTRCLDWCHHSQ